MPQALQVAWLPLVLEGVPVRTVVVLRLAPVVLAAPVRRTLRAAACWSRYQLLQQEQVAVVQVKQKQEAVLATEEGEECRQMTSVHRGPLQLLLLPTQGARAGCVRDSAALPVVEVGQAAMVAQRQSQPIPTADVAVRGRRQHCHHYHNLRRLQMQFHQDGRRVLVSAFCALQRQLRGK